MFAVLKEPKKTKKFFRILILTAGIFGQGILATIGHALPFNDDMVHDQLKTSEVMRKVPEGSIPTNAKLPLIATVQDAEALSNPQRGDKESTINGKRLFAINCTPCHGDYSEKGEHSASRVAGFWPVPPPVLSAEQYRDRSEGSIFATIHFGRGIMPRYGWKLSEKEHWDIVNYVRTLQRK